DGRIGYRYQGKLYTPGELADKLGVRWPNPAGKRATRERAARIRSARLNPWYPKGNFTSREEALRRKEQLEAAGHTVRMVVSAKGTKAENYSVYTRQNPKRAKLTPAEDRAWRKAFQFHVDAGKSDAQADRLAWRDVKKEFPRLKKFSGAKANPRRR